MYKYYAIDLLINQTIEDVAIQCSTLILRRCVYSSVDIVAGQMIIMLIVFTISSRVQHSCTVLAHYYC